MSSSNIVFVALVAMAICGNSSVEGVMTGRRGVAKTFSKLLNATLLEMGIHKHNQTILANAVQTHKVPMSDELYIAGAGAGATRVKKAKKMTKHPTLKIFTWVGTLRSGNILFTRNKQTWQNGVGVRDTSMVREGGWCTKCGALASLEVYEEGGGIPLVGPTVKGLYKVTVDLEQNVVSYKCESMCWSYTNFGTGLYVVGNAVCGAEWDNAYKKKKGPELIKDEDTNIYRATVHMCPFRYKPGTMKIGRKVGSRAKALGLIGGSWQEEESFLAAKGGSGYLTQIRGKTIPGPAVEADYEVVVDMTSGTIRYHCVGDFCNGPDAGPSAYVPENQVHEKGAAFVHLFGWRWMDIAVECETFLGPKGYKGVQIAPPQESKVPPRGKRDSWNYVYRPVSYKLFSKLGSEPEFREMLERCKYAGVDVYADAVINHMSGTSGTGSGGTAFGKRNFPDTGFGSYTPEDFHHNAGDPTTNCVQKAGHEENCKDLDPHTCHEKCDFNGMPDLDTSSPKVQGMLAAYLNHLLDIGVAGFRIDAADHIGSVELKGILENVEPKFRFFEAKGNSDDSGIRAKITMGRVTQFGYKNKLMKTVVTGDISKLRTLGTPQGLVPGEEAVVFIANHDNLMTGDQNGFGATYRNPARYTLGNVLMLALPYGYPKVLSSYYFPEGDTTFPPPTNNVHGQEGELRCGDDENWVCEHRWPAIANMIRWRKYADENEIDLWDSSEQSRVYFCRGKAACILANAGGDDWSVTPKLALAPGDYCNIIESDDGAHCPKVRIDAEGNALMLNSDGSTSDIVVPGTGAVAVHSGAMASAGATE